jgi:hypothetical protein
VRVGRRDYLFEPAPDFGVGDGGFAHVVIHFVVGGGFEDVLFGFGSVTEGFEVEAEVEVGVAEVIATGFIFVARAGGFEYGFDGACAGEEVVNFLHGDPGIARDGDEGLAGGFDVLEAGDAEEVPGGVFDVVGVDGLVDFKLLATLLEFAGVIEGEATLPELGFGLGCGFDDLVEGGDRVGDARFKESVDAGFHPVVGGFGRFLGGRGVEGGEEEQAGGESGHG